MLTATTVVVPAVVIHLVQVAATVVLLVVAVHYVAFHAVQARIVVPVVVSILGLAHTVLKIESVPLVVHEVVSPVATSSIRVVSLSSVRNRCGVALVVRTGPSWATATLSLLESGLPQHLVT